MADEAPGQGFDRCTLVLAVFTGDNGPCPNDYIRYIFIDEAYLQDESDPDQGPLMRQLIDKVDGVHYDACSNVRRRQLDLFFDWVEEGFGQGWAVELRSVTRAAIPGRGVVTRVVTITADP